MNENILTFIDVNKHKQFPVSEWVELDNELEIYVRVGDFYKTVYKSENDVVVLSTIHFRNENNIGRGYFKEFILWFEREMFNRKMTIVVENVLNNVLKQQLEHHGYYVHNTPIKEIQPCLIKQ